MVEKDFRQLITYDISSDKLRVKVAKVLEDYGLERLQYSVFLGSLTRNMLGNVILELKELVKGKEADVRVFFICNHVANNQEIVAIKPGTLGEKEVIPEVVVF